MITKKEDLINTYIENDHGELLDLYIEKAIELGFSHQYGFRGDVRDHYSLRFIGINEYNNSEKNPRIGQTKMEYTPISTGRKITLSDLKPRTCTEYEKATESIFDLRDEFERGELYGDNTGVTKIETLAHLGACCQAGNVFRKVEKEIDWSDEVKRFLESSCKEPSSLDGDSFTISHPDLGFIYEPGDVDFLELCRVALRASGELD